MKERMKVMDKQQRRQTENKQRETERAEKENRAAVLMALMMMDE